MVNLKLDFKVDFNEVEIERKTIKNAQMALLEIMIKIQEHAKREVPVDTGALRNSIIVEPQKPANKIMVSDGVEYGVFVEFGARGRKPNPFFQRAMVMTEKLDMPRILKKYGLAKDL